MSVPPPAETFASRLYLALAPLAYADGSYGWALLTLCSAIGTMFQRVEDLVRDTEAGPGWSILLDLDRCPDEALPWLAQLAGVRVLPGSTPDEMRQRIASTDGFKRGTAAAMTGAAIPTLTGRQRLDFRERTGGPGTMPEDAYFLQARSYSSETPDPAATLRALLSQKPGGLVLDYATVTGQTYDQLKAGYASYAAVDAAYDDYLAVKQDEP